MTKMIREGFSLDQALRTEGMTDFVTLVAGFNRSWLARDRDPNNVTSAESMPPITPTPIVTIRVVSDEAGT